MIQAILLAVTVLGTAITGLGKTAINATSSVLQPLLTFSLSKGLRVLLWIVPVAFGFKLISTILAYTLYHFSMGTVLALSPLVMKSTVDSIIYFILGVTFIYIGELLYRIFK